MFSQNAFWYDVLLEIDATNTESAANLIDGFYSNHTIPEDVIVSFSSIPLKGASEKATHMISITSESSKSLADFRISLSGPAWDLYVSKLGKYIKSSRSSAGKDLYNVSGGTANPIGQAWVFKVDNSAANTFVTAFGKLMKYIKFDVSVSVGQIIHGTDNGESMYIYATYADLNTAFNFGAKNDSEAKVFSTFSESVKGSDLSKHSQEYLSKDFNLLLT